MAANPNNELVPQPWHDPGWKLPQAVFGQGRLSAEETAELTAKMADLVQTGLPLGAGLRAMADEMPHGLWRGSRLATMLRTIAGKLDAGASLEESLASQQERFPRHFYALILTGVRSGRIGQSLEELADIQRQTMDLRRRVWLAMAYPVLLLVLWIVMMIGCATVILPQFARVFDDFGAQLPALTQWVLVLAKPGPAGYLAGLGVVMVGLALLFVLRRWGPVQWVLYRVPLLGDLWRWNSLLEFARLMALLLDQQIALPDALRLTADGVASAELKRACRRAAARVEAGQSPEESFGGEWAVTPSLRPLLAWGQRLPALAEAFHAAAETFEARTQVCVVQFEPMLPPAILLMVGVLAGGLVIALFMPLISLIQRLS